MADLFAPATLHSGRRYHTNSHNTQGSAFFFQSKMPTLSLTQVIERQYELFKRIHNTPDNIKKVGKDNITQELLEARLWILENNWNEFQENYTIILSQKFESTSQSEYFVNDCYGATEEGYNNSAAYIASLLRGFLQQNNLPVVQQTVPTRKLPKIKVPSFSGKFTLSSRPAQIN